MGKISFPILLESTKLYWASGIFIIVLMIAIGGLAFSKPDRWLEAVGIFVTLLLFQVDQFAKGILETSQRIESIYYAYIELGKNINVIKNSYLPMVRAMQNPLMATYMHSTGIKVVIEKNYLDSEFVLDGFEWFDILENVNRRFDYNRNKNTKRPMESISDSQLFQEFLDRLTEIKKKINGRYKFDQ